MQVDAKSPALQQGDGMKDYFFFFPLVQRLLNRGDFCPCLHVLCAPLSPTEI